MENGSLKIFLVGTEDGIQKMTVQEVLAAEDSEEMKMYQEFANAVVVIFPEGTVYTYFAISEDGRGGVSPLWRRNVPAGKGGVAFLEWDGR